MQRRQIWRPWRPQGGWGSAVGFAYRWRLGGQVPVDGPLVAGKRSLENPWERTGITLALCIPFPPYCWGTRCGVEWARLWPRDPASQHAVRHVFEQGLQTRFFWGGDFLLGWSTPGLELSGRLGFFCWGILHSNKCSHYSPRSTYFFKKENFIRPYSFSPTREERGEIRFSQIKGRLRVPLDVVGMFDGRNFPSVRKNRKAQKMWRQSEWSRCDY